jgi:hypothetical protein
MLNPSVYSEYPYIHLHIVLHSARSSSFEYRGHLPPSDPLVLLPNIQISGSNCDRMPLSSYATKSVFISVSHVSFQYKIQWNLLIFIRKHIVLCLYLYFQLLCLSCLHFARVGSAKYIWLFFFVKRKTVFCHLQYYLVIPIPTHSMSMSTAMLQNMIQPLACSRSNREQRHRHAVWRFYGSPNNCSWIVNW